MNETEQKAWHAVHVTDSKNMDVPVAMFEWDDHAHLFAEKHYPGRYEIRPCAAPDPRRPDTPNLNSLDPFMFTIEPGWYWVGTGVKIGGQDRMLVVQKATDADVARLQGESAPRGPQCEECKGTGRIESPFHGGGMDCPHCSGKGWLPIKESEQPGAEVK